MSGPDPHLSSCKVSLCHHFGLRPTGYAGDLVTRCMLMDTTCMPGSTPDLVGPGNPNPGKLHVIFVVPYIVVIRIAFCLTPPIRSVHQGWLYRSTKFPVTEGSSKYTSPFTSTRSQATNRWLRVLNG